MNTGTQEYARMQNIAIDIGKKWRKFTQDKNNICIFALTKDRPEGDLFAPCIYGFYLSEMNAKLMYVYDNKTSNLNDLEKKYDGITIFRCIENAPIRTMTCCIDENGNFEITYHLCGDKFENDDGFCFYYELGFDR